jgi:L-asparagine transporter-like permease
MFTKIRKVPLSDLLTYAFSVGVVLIWVFAPETNILLLLGMTLFAIALNIMLFSAKKLRKKNEAMVKQAEAAREHIGDSDDTNQKDKYYF